MRTVDFACSLLVNVSRIDLTPNDIKVLLAVATGLRDALAIAELLDIRPCVSTIALRSMDKRGLVHHIGENCYVLAPDGERRVRKLLTIAPTMQ